MKKLILDTSKIEKKILRIAYQIAESVCEETEVHFVCIATKGSAFGKHLQKDLSTILPNLTIHIHSMQLDKTDPLASEILLSTDISSFENKTIFLLDDVVNTGKTMFYALTPFMNIKPKSIQTAVLVDREHKDFPILSNFIGLSLSTTLLEHIQVEIENNEIVGVYLM
jgi:pyrimidine operon attenuation protein / uracil phosphoribosyltransferase